MKRATFIAMAALGLTVIGVLAFVHGLPAFIRDVGTNVGVGGIVGALGALGGAVGAGPDGASGATAVDPGFGGDRTDKTGGHGSGWYAEPNVRVDGGPGFTWWPTRSDAGQYTGRPVYASPMIFFSVAVHNICAAIAGEASATRATSSCTKA